MKVQEIEKDEKDFENSLNDMYGSVTICGMDFDSGSALKELDPIAFRCALSDEPITYQCGVCDKSFDECEFDEADDCCKDNDA
jgi:hypothetical protein